MSVRTLLLLSATTVTVNAGWAHGWRDQYIRVSQQLGQKVSAELRHARKLGLLGEGEGAPEHLKQKARDAVQHAERVHHAQRHNARELAKPEHQRRKLMDVECSGRSCTVNGMTHADMSLFDCPWVNSLHPYLNTTITADSLLATGSLPGAVPVVDPMTESPHPYLRAEPNAFVDGGLCLPFQEIPFPFPSTLYGGVDKAAANIQCPGPDWDPDAGACSSGPGTCEYAGDKSLFGGPTGVAENYGCAAASFGWPTTSEESGETRTPVCKTYVDKCTFSKPPTRKYKYEPAAATDPLSLGGGYDYNWVLWSVGKIRNELGLGADMAADLNGGGYAFPGFPTNLYETLYGKPEGTPPPSEGSYPHAAVKGLFTPEGVVDTARDGECSRQDSATQWLDCGIPCPIGDEARMSKDDLAPFGGVVLAFMFVCALIGAAAFFVVGGNSEKFFVGGRTLNIFVVTATLASQSLDSNAALGNIDLGYKYHWWDGAALPIGLGLSLVLNGIFFARPLNEMRLLTLPDLFARKFGPAVEVTFSILALISFLCLLGGNLVGCGRILAFVFDISIGSGVWISTFVIWLYTFAGGLVAVAYTDVGQACVGWIGLLAGSFWVMANMPSAAGVSPAYPVGDQTQINAQMTDADALDPIPNAIVFNWATIFVLAFGNLAALDFQARVFSAKTPNTAAIGCILGGVISWVVGCTFSHCSGAARALYGPSSPYAEFVADSCSKEITVVGCFGEGCTATVLNGVPTCGEWKPDEWAPLKLFTCTKPDCHYMFDFDGSATGALGGALSDGHFPMNGFIGGWVLISIIAASMSTGDGAILAMSTVFAHNLLRKLRLPFLREEKNLLLLARASTAFWAPFGGLIASLSPSESGYLLIIAFDIMLAGSVVPMFAAVYWKGCKPLAAWISMIGGSLLRLVLEFVLPKDYLLLLVGSYAMSFGPGAYGGLDITDGAPLDGWCPQYDLKDFTGIDSLLSPAFSLLLLLLFNLPCMPSGRGVVWGKAARPFDAVAPPPPPAEDEPKSEPKLEAAEMAEAKETASATV